MVDQHFNFDLSKIVLGLKNLPLIHSYSSIQALSKDISKSEREHDLVIAVSYVLILFKFDSALPESVIGDIEDIVRLHFGSCVFLLSLFNCLGNGMKSYVLGEIPSLQDRITIVRQLWDLTRDVLV